MKTKTKILLFVYLLTLYFTFPTYSANGDYPLYIKFIIYILKLCIYFFFLLTLFLMEYLFFDYVIYLYKKFILKIIESKSDVSLLYSENIMPSKIYTYVVVPITIIKTNKKIIYYKIINNFEENIYMYSSLLFLLLLTIIFLIL